MGEELQRLLRKKPGLRGSGLRRGECGWHVVPPHLGSRPRPQTRLKEFVARRGRDVYVAADSPKLGLQPFPCLSAAGAIGKAEACTVPGAGNQHNQIAATGGLETSVIAASLADLVPEDHPYP